MSTAGMIKVPAGCPTFDGTDYPYWKNMMRMHLETIEGLLNILIIESLEAVEEISNNINLRVMLC